MLDLSGYLKELEQDDKIIKVMVVRPKPTKLDKAIGVLSFVLIIWPVLFPPKRHG